MGTEERRVVLEKLKKKRKNRAKMFREGVESGLRVCEHSLYERGALP